MSTISVDAYFDRLHRFQTVLDRENIKIVRTMKQEGPRNLQKIARASKIPYTTVYSRVSKLQGEGLLTTSLHPYYSRIGLSQAKILITPLPGRELLAREALKIPGFWLKIARCVGECNGYYCLAAVPTKHMRDFEEYLEQLVVRGVVRDTRISWLGESTSPISNFDHYDTSTKTWRFEWKQWSTFFKRRDKRASKITKETTQDYDKRDLIILKELSLDARTTLARLAKLLSITLPAAKYRFEGLLAKGLIGDYIIDILPFAFDVSDYSEVRLDFKDELLMQNGEKALSELPFVVTYTPLRALNSLTVRMYLPRIELNNMFSFLSQLVKDKVLTSYSYMQLDPMTLQVQTIAYKDYTDDAGWIYDNRKYLDLVDNLLSNWPRREAELIDIRTGSAVSIHEQKLRPTTTHKTYERQLEASL